MSKYVVESIVCDWANYSIDNYENKDLVEVCNSKANLGLFYITSRKRGEGC